MFSAQKNQKEVFKKNKQQLFKAVLSLYDNATSCQNLKTLGFNTT